MILDEIVAHKLEELAQRREDLPLAELKAMMQKQPAPLDFAATLRRPGVNLIAEVKRASPSRGVFRSHFAPVSLARCYAANGAAAISVLTEERYFQGSLDDLAQIREAVSLPLLRKDFIVDPYQVYEARAYGADALLLIAALLDDEELACLLDLIHELGMTALVEVHDEGELQRVLTLRPKIIGINNRNLADFSVDLKTTSRLRPLIPAEVIVVSESGIQTRADAEQLSQAGVNAILVGTALVQASDIGAKVRELAYG